MRGLTGKVAIIAGAGAGIGAASARRLAQEGVSVVVGEKTIDAAVMVVDGIKSAGGNAQAVAFDITEEASVKALIDSAIRAFGGIDMFLANAADTHIRLQDTDAVDVALEVFDRTIAVGMRGHLICTRYAIPALLARGGGVMLYTSSDGTRVAEPRRVCYAMAKSGVNALMRHVASRWGKEGIRTNAISPGLIQTETVLASHTPESRAAILSVTRSHRLGEPEDIAAMVAMLMSDDAAFIQGQVISVNGGIVLRD